MGKIIEVDEDDIHDAIVAEMQEMAEVYRDGSYAVMGFEGPSVAAGVLGRLAEIREQEALGGELGGKHIRDALDDLRQDGQVDVPSVGA